MTFFGVFDYECFYFFRLILAPAWRTPANWPNRMRFTFFLLGHYYTYLRNLTTPPQYLKVIPLIRKSEKIRDPLLRKFHLCLFAKYTKKRAITDTPIIMINADQNWNHPLSVPVKRKTLATTAAPNQKIKSPTL